ncbi:MAG: helix-turn-helix transcriptional regulator [Paludibacter sp.]|nr:helix-turn-helix transcriptional regulator [Paludibacter sp.]
MNIAKNISEIRKEKGLNQQIIADALDADVSVVSNIETGKRELKVSELEKIAKSLGVDTLYLLTYPHIYVKKDMSDREPVEAILQIKLQSDKKEQVLKLVFGENNLEILNK